ncbi:MAG TPA: DUF2490 domain-containing protein [Edaphobacter sp.]
MGKTLTRIFWGVTVAATICQTSNAQSTQQQFLPEIDSYWTLAPVMRVQTLVARTKDGDSFNSATVGSGIDFFVKPLSSTRRTNWDEANRKLLTFGVTYRFIHNVDKADENRLQFDVSPKYPLPKDMLIDDRNRLELRVISGDVTWRYRNRLTFQRTFQTHRFKFTPYARAEAFYEINQGEWSEWTYSFGGFIPISEHIEVEPYYERQDLYGSKPSHVNAFGITLAFYFRKSAANKSGK